MVTKKRKAATVRTRTVYRAKPRKRKSSTGYDKIAPAMATAALVAVNAKPAVKLFNEATVRGYSYKEVMNRLKNDNGTKAAIKDVIGVPALTRDAIALAGGYVGGEIIRKYAPTVIKRPIAKIAKKIPKVI